MNSNAIPMLLRRVQAKEPRNPVLRFLSRFQPKERRAWNLHLMAEWGLMDGWGQSAVPTLAEMPLGPNHDERECAMNCVDVIHPNEGVLLAALIKMHGSPDQLVSEHSAAVICNECPSYAEAAGAYTILPYRRPPASTNALGGK